MSWRRFDFGKVDAEVAQARGANAEALAQYRQAALKASEDIEGVCLSPMNSRVAAATALPRG